MNDQQRVSAYNTYRLGDFSYQFIKKWLHAEPPKEPKVTKTSRIKHVSHKIVVFSLKWSNF